MQISGWGCCAAEKVGQLHRRGLCGLRPAEQEAAVMIKIIEMIKICFDQLILL
jgi:hypothetical protein